MKATILYASRYGYTESVARDVASRLAEAGVQSDLVEAHRWTAVSEESELVIVGAPIYGGTIAGGLVGCLELNAELLLERPLYFFLSCLNDGDQAERQLADSVPPRLMAHARGKYYVGGRVDMDTLRWMDRQVMRRIAGVTESVDRTSPEQVDALVQDVLSSS